LRSWLQHHWTGQVVRKLRKETNKKPVLSNGILSCVMYCGKMKMESKKQEKNLVTYTWHPA
jgi:hypothetical protein